MPFDEGIGLFLLRKRKPRLQAKPERKLKIGHHAANAATLRRTNLTHQKN